MTADPTPPSRPGSPRVRIASVEPRILGLMSPPVAVIAGSCALVLGIIVIASGAGVGGTILLLGGALLVTLAVSAARRWPASALPRTAGAVADTLGERLGLARASAGAWSTATREKAQLEREIRKLRDERRREQADLGEAAYREQPGRVDRLRRRVGAIDRRIERRQEEIGEVDAQAHERIERERIAAPSTREYAVAEDPPPLAEDDDTRVSPTEERPVRS
jgi:hypothetical protein